MDKKRILIYGDAMLDTYIHGSVSRISPEAPIPVLQVSWKEEKIGGAGNVANNLSALNVVAGGFFLWGNDADAIVLKSLLEKNGVDTQWAINDDSLRTIKKERVICKNQQIVRMDYNDTYSISQDLREKIFERLPSAIQWADIVIISDYGKGACEEAICKAIIRHAREEKKPVIVDPKGRNWEKYRGATVITPNMSEINLYSGTNVKNENAEIEANYADMYETLGISYLLLTRSEKGMSLIGKDTMTHIEAVQREVFDVSGAGDTVVAALAATLKPDLSNIRHAVNVANIAAGIVVGKPGTAVVSKKELYDALNSRGEQSGAKVFHMDDPLPLQEQLARWRAAGEKIVTTNGCFDIVHRGHVSLLNHAKAYADRLIVAINADASVKRLKGPSRPINNEEDRAFVIASMKCVDAVVIFNPLKDNQQIPAEEYAQLTEEQIAIAKEAPMGVLRLIRPDVHAKGGDYVREGVPEAMYAADYEAIPFVDGYSTTKAIEKCK